MVTPWLSARAEPPCSSALSTFMLHIDPTEPKTPANLCVEEFALGEGGRHRPVRPFGNVLVDIAPSGLKDDQELMPLSLITESTNAGRWHGIVTHEPFSLSSTWPGRR